MTDRITQLERQLAEARAEITWAIETLQEINPSNYDHDDVCSLNAASVEVALGLQAFLNKARAAIQGEPA